MLIGVTKVPESSNANGVQKCIIGGLFPNHTTCAQYLQIEWIKKMLDNRDEKGSTKDAIELVSKIKIAVIVFENLPKTTSLIAIIAARPQSNNETSSFAKDTCEVVRLILNDLDQAQLANFTADSASVKNMRQFANSM